MKLKVAQPQQQQQQKSLIYTFSVINTKYPDEG